MLSVTPPVSSTPIDRPRVHSHPETILGTCQAIGDDLGINPNWLRAAFGVALVWNIAAAVGAYLLLSLLVLVLRRAMPDERGSRPADAATVPDNDHMLVDHRDAA
ncbi:PspC domain-containing protein [Sphingomonas sp. ASV193]|uniref:PspC domain-containing protein n=1 Tax=Sphingomonas sp. ASV193 TaxID=3144405 RepID=UPI0032E92870